MNTIIKKIACQMMSVNDAIMFIASNTKKSSFLIFDRKCQRFKKSISTWKACRYRSQDYIIFYKSKFIK